MQKFIAHNVYGTNSHGAAVTEVTPAGEPKQVYLASAVDAKFKEYDDDNLALSQSVVKLGARIEELEKVLRLCFQELYPTGTTFEDAYAEALKVANELCTEMGKEVKS
jgi:hypothetical protein